MNMYVPWTFFFAILFNACVIVTESQNGSTKLYGKKVQTGKSIMTMIPEQPERPTIKVEKFRLAEEQRHHISECSSLNVYKPVAISTGNEENETSSNFS